MNGPFTFAYDPRVRPVSGSLWLVLSTSGLLVADGWSRDGGLPHWRGDVPVVLEEGAFLVGRVGERPCFAAWAGDAGPLSDGAAFRGLRDLKTVLADEEWAPLARVAHLMHWHRNSRFCGHCGLRTEWAENECAKVCPHCSRREYPRICPAVIVRVEREGALLLARSPHFPKGRFSVLAGFVEPGESLESAVAREIREEVGIGVTDIRYFGSQAWPFPDSLMVAFTARGESGDLTLQPGEIEEAGWFFPGGFPELPPQGSVSRRLIEDFCARS